MPSKISTGFILFGSGAIFMALCTLPAALEKNADNSTMALAASLFCLGTLIIACGVYLKARVLQTAAAPVETSAKPSPQQRGGCELCGKESPVVKCKVHQLDLCGTCLARHYDYRSCSYVPASSGSANKAPRAMAKSRGF